jgi:hypothetical protein
MNSNTNAGFQELVTLWDSERRRAASSSKALRFIIIYGFAILPLLTTFQIWRAFRADDYLAVFFLSLSAAPVIWALVIFWRKWQLVKNGLLVTSEMKGAPEEIYDGIWALIDKEAEAVGMARERVRIFVRTDRYDVNLGIVESKNKKEIKIYVSLGFCKVIFSNPCQARAMLLHEIGHVLNGDSRLWGLVSVYYQVYIRVLLPPLLILAAVFFILGLIGLSNIAFAMDKLKEDRLMVEREIEEIKSKLSWEYEMALFSEEMKVSREFWAKRGELENAAMEIRFSLASLVMTPVGIMFIYRSVKAARRRSERLADLVVSLFGDGAGLAAAVNQFENPVINHSPLGFLTQFHPCGSERVIQIEKDMELIHENEKNSPRLKKLRSDNRKTGAYRRVKFAFIVGGIFALVPSVMIFASDAGDDRLEAVYMTGAFFMIVSFMALMFHLVGSLLAKLFTRKDAVSFPVPVKNIPASL